MSDFFFLFIIAPLFVVVMPCLIVYNRYFGDREEYDSFYKYYTILATYMYILTRFYFVAIPLLIIWLVINILL